MKKLFIQTSVYSITSISMALFMGGMVWSLVPIGGATMPHWLESISGISFNGAALLISLLLGIACVTSFALPYIFQPLETATQKADSKKEHGYEKYN
ncbi:hypothetical protein P4C99_11260 [Pontiellaceae bacterium B1224]|nr:hypothetical protein [Pontiellaceae bacterium B1224]